MSKVELTQIVMAANNCSITEAIRSIDQATSAVWVCRPIRAGSMAPKNATITFITGDSYDVHVDQWAEKGDA